MNVALHGMSPRMRPLPAKRSIDVSILDVGTSKIICLIARLKPIESGDVLPGRTHRVEILGVGHQRSRGIKGGNVVDMEAAERAIRFAVDSAERMADVRVESVVVAVTAGRLASDAYNASVAIGQRPVADADIQRVLRAGSTHSVRPGRMVLHSLPMGYALDDTRGIRDPRGMVADKLGVDMHVVSAEAAPLRNLVLCVERCHLKVEALVAAPYASGLAALVDDESELGVTVVDMGGGTTSIAIFTGGHFVHVDAVALGGNHVTLDVARGLTIRMEHAERLKTLHASSIPCLADDHEMIAVTPVGEEEGAATHHIPKAELVKIVRPRVEEILELVRDRLKASGFAAEAGRRVVLTGGASQLNGLADLAGRVLDRQIRIGRPLGVKGLPEAAKGPAFTAAVGLLVYPQVAGIEQFEPARPQPAMTGTHGYLSRVGQWLKESF